MQPASNELHSRTVELEAELDVLKKRAAGLERENTVLRAQVEKLKQACQNALLGLTKLRSGLRYLPKPERADDENNY